MYLEFIHFFVETLDTLFDRVTEKDLVFGFHHLYAIVDELILAGEIQETSKNVIFSRMDELKSAAKM
eukprot:TRINITY_DN3079_c3_g5_i1.p1 TRINITY_DN3079_c3_g5~~TRINITY_DN3079_c3_g5_i1.p1  ORF type:complete len:67 (-),score=20.85 TRINITY_DN3079_c3_g5_i1:47-247(-)